MGTAARKREGGSKQDSTWCCDECGKSIKPAREGIIIFTDPKTGGYPRWGEVDEIAVQKQQHAGWEAIEAQYGDGEGKAYAVPLSALLEQEPQPPRCHISVLHDACNSARDAFIPPYYWIDLAEAQGDKLLEWVAHLLGKTWFGAEEARTLIRRYLRARRG